MTTARPILAEPEVAAQIQELERRHELFAILEDDISLWRLLRFEVSVHLQNLDLRRQPMSRGRLLMSLPRAAWQFATARPGLTYVGKTSNSGLRDRRAGVFRDIYFDDLIDAVPGGALFSSLDAAGFVENSRNAHRCPVFDDTSVIVASALLGRVLGKQTASPGAQRISEIINAELAIDDFCPRYIQRKYDVYRFRVALYKRVLKRFGVRAVLAANTGLHALTAACHALDIPYVEIQHGDFGIYHPESIPASTLSDGIAPLVLPDRLAVFGERDVAALTHTALGALGRLRAVGAPAIAAARELRERDFVPDPECPIVTFTSQGFARGEVDEFITQFLAAYVRPLRFIIRLHPGYDGDGANYREIAARDRRVEVMSSDTEVSTHQIIALSDLHVSISSTCHYDAFGIGTPTSVLGLPGHAAMAELVASKAATLVETPKQLAEMLTSQSWSPVTPDQSSYVFRPGYITNMTQLLSELGVALE